MAVQNKKKRNSKGEKKFNDPIAVQKIVLNMFEQAPHKAFHVEQIHKHLNQNIDWTPDVLTEHLLQWSEDGVLERVDGTRFRMFQQSDLHEGVFHITKEGYGAVFIEELLEEVMISERGSERPFHGDRVSVRILRKKNELLRGAIVEIVKRKRDLFVGTLGFTTRGAFFIPQENKVKPDFYINKKDIGKAKNGDKVIVELLEWEDERPIGRVVEVIGASGNHQTEMHAIMMEFGLHEEFPDDIEKAAADARNFITPEAIAARRDFRNILTFTIDPADAKDFDDAISFEQLDEEHFRIGIHIADVSFFVREDTPLDNEAYDRATSVYLVDRTVPMLPEILSNDLCSLVPHQDRMTYSAVFDLNKAGEIQNEWFGRTIIYSDHRFSYEQAQDVLDGKSDTYSKELTILNHIAYELRKDRFAAGSIDFDSDEVKFKLDVDGKPIEVFRKDRKDAHRLIEDYMLLANRKVAAFIAQSKRKPEYPFVYRIHPPPERERLETLQAFVSQFGHSITIDMEHKDRISKSINQLVNDVVGRPEQNIVQSVAIRSMPKAIYTTKNIGHYGLGFRYYTHFTSPIRRYPDVLVHRQLDRILNQRVDLISSESLDVMCRHCSEQERTAADAERASVKYKQVEFLEARKDQELDGIISGLTEWGIYVEIDDIKCEGMIPLRDLRDDNYVLDDKKFKLTGQKRGKTFKLGQRLRVKVMKTNIVKRIIDFEFLERLEP